MAPVSSRMTHEPYSLGRKGLGKGSTGPSLTRGQKIALEVVLDFMDHKDLNPGNAGVHADALESVIAARPGWRLDVESWSLGRWMAAAQGGAKLKDLLQANRHLFKFCGNVVTLQVPQPQPAHRELKEYKLRVRAVVGTLAGRCREEACRMVTDAVVLLLQDPDCTRGSGSVPVNRVWSALVQTPQDADIMLMTLGLNEQGFPGFLADRPVVEVFCAGEPRRQRHTVWHVRLADNPDWEALNAANQQTEAESREHWRRALARYLLQCNQHCCSLTKFKEAHQQLPYKLGDFVKLIKHWADNFFYDGDSKMILLKSLP